MIGMKKLYKGVRAHPTKRQWFASIPLLDGRVSTPARSTAEEAARDYDNVIFYCSEWLTCRREFNFPAEWEDAEGISLSNAPAATEATLKIKSKLTAKIEEGLIDPVAWKEAQACQHWRDIQKDARHFSAHFLRTMLDRPSIDQIEDIEQRWEELIFEIKRRLNQPV